ncbi:MAG: hypothetical protein RR636_04790 [Clostridium sp.]|uniref:hypothetical protein n=1 Tax=Clostridium sp. TaxID=1506 RepID=UPI0030511B0B
MLTLLLILNIMVFIGVVIYIGKNILGSYKLSDSWLKNTSIIVLICIAAYGTFLGTFSGMVLIQEQDIIEYKTSKTLTEEEKLELAKEEEIFEANKSEVQKSTTVTCTTFAMVLGIQHSINKKKKNTPTAGKWDLSKYK